MSTISGRRKEATAVVRLTKGKGTLTVNKKNIDEYFGRDVAKMIIRQPLVLTKSENTYDIDEYIVDISKNEGLVEGMQPVDGGISLHLACHSRAQNMGAKSNELLKLIPDADISIVERCSGHGGTFGVLSPTHDLARKVGKPAARQVAKVNPSFVISSCPLASKHLSQITKEDIIKGNEKSQIKSGHPIELMAVSYGFLNKDEMSE